MHPTTNLLTLLLTLTSTWAASPPTTDNDHVGSTFTASFTRNQNCGDSIACNGGHSTQYSSHVLKRPAAAANTWVYYNGPAGTGNQYNVGKGCGQCWKLTPQKNFGPGTEGQGMGKAVTVMVTDQCADGGRGDQEFGELNGEFGMQTHFDLCESTDVVGRFFGEGENGKGQPGILTGMAERVADGSC